MPEDAAQREIDGLLKDSMRKGVTPEPEPGPWTIHSIRATLPDGGGAQSIAIALQSGKSRKTAMLLLKQGQGVKDAFTIPCRSAKDQKAIMDRMTEDVGGLTVTKACLGRAIALRVRARRERRLRLRHDGGPRRSAAAALREIRRAPA
jgi:hypothetical protein